MKKLFLFLFVITQLLYSQQIKFNKDSLYFPNKSSSDQLTIYNIGLSSLHIAGFNTTSHVGYHLNIVLKDTTKSINLTIHTQNNQKASFSIEPGDSAFIFVYDPYCPLCKLSSYYYGNIVIHSNSILDSNANIFVHGDDYITTVDNYSQIKGFELYQNYPNPFNPVTSISFYLPCEEYTTISIYNNLGQRVSNIFSGILGNGNYTKSWDASKYASGFYFYKLETKSFNCIKKMILLK